jgi:peptidoglycan/LPS O-acetylase OafA/YrhL
VTEKSSEATHAPIHDKERIVGLDGLRGIAILSVMVYHEVGLSNWLFNGPHTLGSVEAYLSVALAPLASGVDLFFVLSGFFIGGILLDSRTSTNVFKTFYIRRFFRIIPLAWVWIALTFAIHHNDGEGGPAWMYFTFTVNSHYAALQHWPEQTPLVPIWSLCIEEQFYLLLPLLLCRCDKKWVPWIGPVLICIALGLRMAIALQTPFQPFAAHVTTLTRLDSLGMGLTVAWLVRSRFIDQILARRTAIWGGIIAGGCAVVAQVHWRNDHVSLVLSYFVFAVIYACALLLVYQSSEGWVRRTTQSAFLVKLGRYSFFLYLFGQPAQVVANTVLGHASFTGAIYTLAHCVVFAAFLGIFAPLSWRYFEKPLVDIGRKWKY